MPGSFPFAFHYNVESAAKCDEICNEVDGCMNFFYSNIPEYNYSVCMPTRDQCILDNNPYVHYYRSTNTPAGTGWTKRLESVKIYLRNLLN